MIMYNFLHLHRLRLLLYSMLWYMQCSNQFWRNIKNFVSFSRCEREQFPNSFPVEQHQTRHRMKCCDWNLRHSERKTFSINSMLIILNRTHNVGRRIGCGSRKCQLIKNWNASSPTSYRRFSSIETFIFTMTPPIHSLKISIFVGSLALTTFSSEC